MATDSRQMQKQFALLGLLTPLRQRLRQRLQILALRYPVLGLAVAGLAALPGLLVLIGLPLAALLLAWQLPAALMTASTAGHWLGLALDSAVIALGATLAWGLLRLPASPLSGVVLEHAKAPALFDLIGELEAGYGRPAVERIVIRPEFTLHLQQEPRPGWPGRSHPVLVIGLPLLLTLPPEHFRALLARRIGQHSLRHNLSSGVLTRLRSLFHGYRRSTARGKSLPHRLMHAFFRRYTPFYQHLSTYAAELDELQADRYALALINDRDLAVAISQEIVTRDFVAKKFWPKVRQLHKRGSETGQRPFAHLTAVVRRGLGSEDVQHSLQAALRREKTGPDAQAPLRDRLENMGHDRPGTPRALSETAAMRYLPPATEQQLIRHFDAIWQQRRQRRKGLRAGRA